MMPNIADRGAGAGDLMQYLVDTESVKNRNVHDNPHVVAGSVGQEFLGATLYRDDARMIAQDLHLHQQMHQIDPEYKHVWHCSLALSPEDPRPSDEKWRAVADDFMQRMGFTGPGKSPVLWVAVEHGLSENGNSHIHIVASTIRENGTKVRLHNDMERAQKVSLLLEQTHGLKVLESRLVGVGGRGYSMDAAVQADRAGLTEVRPIQLERKVRELAVASQSEAEFVRRARAAGLLLKPRVLGTQVTGYSVGYPATDGESQRMYAGGTLARDLTIGGLRRSWPDGGGSQAEAFSEWTKGTANKPVFHGLESHPVSLKPDTVKAVSAGLDSLAVQMPTATDTEFAVLSRDLSGALAAASSVVEGDKPGPLARASRDVARYAQGKAVVPSRPTGLTLRGVAAMLIVSKDPTGPEAQRVMQRTLIEALLKLYRLHQATRPVAMNRKGKGMTQASIGEPDQVGPAIEGLATTSLTAGALVVEMAAMRAGRDKRELSKSTPTISEEERAGMDAAQQAQVAPPGPATKAQLDRLDELAEAAGTHVRGVHPPLSETTRGMNAKEVDDLIAVMESATPEGWKPTAENPEYREARVRETMGSDPVIETLSKQDPRSFQGPDPLGAPSPADVKQTAAAPVQPSGPKPDILARPSDWRRGEQKLTNPQRGYLVANGFDPKAVGNLTVSQAAGVIGPHKRGDQQGAQEAWVAAVNGEGQVVHLNQNQDPAKTKHHQPGEPKRPNNPRGRKA